MATRRNLGIPSGVVFQSAATTAPYGYLLCDGSEVLKTDYPSLYAAIGDNYGTPIGGSLYFCLPDYRGRFLRGIDGVAGNDPDKATRTAMKTGAVTGNNVGSVQDHNTSDHSHDMSNAYGKTFHQGSGDYQTVQIGTPAWTGNIAQGGDVVAVVGSATGGTAIGGTTGTVATSAGTGETRPKNVNVNFIIKY